jgi:hypothetical protein
VLAANMATAPLARAAEDNLLHGPHPFLKDNELSAHMLLAAGGANTPDGGKLALDYGYKLRGPIWLNLQINSQHGSCQSLSGGTVCPSPAGWIYETLAGVKLKWPTAIPIVPFVKGAVGLAFSFPTGRSSGWGVAGRVGGGASYFVFDWLGLGLEIGFSTGYLTTASPTYTVLDFGGGVEFQF